MSKKAKPALPPMDAFFTRPLANEGIELPLTLPDGTPTEHKIRIRGRDSDVSIAEAVASKRRVLAATNDLITAKDLEAKLIELTNEERLRTIAALIISWTFDYPCDEKHKLQLLRDAPQIAEQIDVFSSKRSLFFRKGLTSSSSSQGQNLS